MFIQILRPLLFASAYVSFELVGIENTNWWHFFEYGISLRGLLYFCMGLYLRQYPISCHVPMWGRGGLIVASIGLLLSNVPMVFVVPVCMVALYEIMYSERAILSGYSFPIYLMHGMFLTISSVALALCGIRTSTCANMWIWAARALFAVVGSIGATWLLRRYLPKVASVIFGGR